MYLSALAFVAGVLTLPLFTHIPPLVWFFPALIIIALLCYRSKSYYQQALKLLFFALLGCLFVLFYSQQILRWQLPQNLETETITVVGTIITLPKIEDDTVQFEFALASIGEQPQHAHIQLSWYHYEGAPLQTGDRWQLQVRLKRPHSLLNPGGFDYEKWLFSKGLRATGYVVNPLDARLLASAPWHYPVDHVREYLQQKIDTHLHGQPTAGLITALVMGAQNGITQEQWRVMRATGTNHLMAIAGVHIAFVSGFIYLLTNFLWRRSSSLLLKLPAPQAAACGALIAAIIYSALAGFALPTQRALIMLLVFMAGLFFRRELNPWNSLLLALWLVVIWDPLATLSISFWLSFAAVFAIIYGISGRLKPRGLWWKYGRVQWVITIALIPITLVLFQQSSLISFIANLIAVPAVGIFVLPLCLSGALLAVIFPFSGHWVLWLAAKIIAVIWLMLAWLGNLHGAIWQQNIPDICILLAAVIGILLLISPRGLPGRWMSLFWLAPLGFFHPTPPPFGVAQFSLLDVGQGLSAVVQTQHHALIFDTGPPMGKQDDAGGRVILPFLQTVGISKLDMLVISHGDSDHIGGAFTLLRQMPVQQILTSVPERFPNTAAKTCQAGQTWEWDGVIFRMLYPSPELLGQDNNSSCVLHIETKNGSILLTGDIEKPAEAYLVAHAALQLPATILIAPHHGSQTSSTQDFVTAVHPNTVFFPVGYKNRYQFPSKIVVARYQQAGTAMFDTAKSGAIMVGAGGVNTIKIITQRSLEKNIWHEK